jgi:transcription-repair coupling factor (superfamily II helicase)
MPVPGKRKKKGPPTYAEPFFSKPLPKIPESWTSGVVGKGGSPVAPKDVGLEKLTEKLAQALPAAPARRSPAAAPAKKEPTAKEQREAAKVMRKSPAPRQEKGAVADLRRALLKSKEFKQRLEGLSSAAQVVLDHVTQRAFGFVAAAVLEHCAKAHPKARLWFVAADVKTQDLIHADLNVWGLPALYFPKEQRSAAADALNDPDVQAERITALSRLRERKEAQSIVLLAESLDEEVPALRDLSANERRFTAGAKLDPDKLIAELEDAGYERVPQVTERGQYARRGGILDFYSWQADEPLRLELFDDEIESLRTFDLHHQGSVQRLKEAAVILHLAEDEAASSKVSSHIAAEDIVVALDCEVPGMKVRILSGSGLDAGGVEDFSTAIFDNPLGMFDASDFVLHEARRKQYQTQIEEWQKQGWKVTLFFHNDAELTRYTELMGEAASSLKTEHILGLLYRGFVVPGAKLAVLSGAELFGRHQVIRRIRGSKLESAQSMRQAREMVRDLREGDLVVHKEQGIGKFLGIQVRDGKEMLVLEYAEKAKFYLSTAHAHLVSRYVGVGGKAPTLNKLGDGKWTRTKKQAERSVEEFAAKMLSVAAERQALRKTRPHEPDTKWQTEFEESFIYRETPDQLSCVEQIKRDMEGQRPMDRLLCADVGFGKTEVAIRAAFKAVMGGRQVAILVPTTVLCSQHTENIRQRMSEFPVTVEMLCRLTSPEKEREVLAGIKNGSVDIVIGTHRLISKDVVFKDLGLAVVDEEQRFGVKVKERFKELFRLIDVLTLSATPIPRTLYLSLMGMRDMSSIETPPINKQPVQTLVCSYDERTIRDAIDAEIDRGGQVFFLHNRISDIEDVARKIKVLCPKARVIIGHGQMEGELLEDVMHHFVEGHADVLVSTTIIESGVDIPNANTILIDRADRFGLADLYQLRGRVGRGGQKAYAYLMLPKDFVTGGDARKRVNAMKQYTALGSGFKIAMRDLEIRGAGNLLGTEQSGHIAAVGFDMYCQMLKQAVNKNQGKPTQRPIDVGFRADFLCLSEAAYGEGMNHLEPAFIPSTFLDDAKLRIQAYRSIAEVSTRKELDELAAEWRDQHGKLPPAMENLLLCTSIRLAAAYVNISDLEVKDRKLMLMRSGHYVMLDNKFPRLSAMHSREMLEEMDKLLRQL